MQGLVREATHRQGKARMDLLGTAERSLWSTLVKDGRTVGWWLPTAYSGAEGTRHT